ncbi:transposase [Streptomyces sp. NPDC002309]
MGHVEKWQLALDMIADPVVGHRRSPGRRGCRNGDAAAFRYGLQERNLPYAVGISGRHTAHPADARPVQPACVGTGRPPRMQYPEPAQTVK